MALILAMEPTKQAALMICLQRTQLDLATAQQEKNKQTARATKAEGEVSKLRAAINASGSENLRRIVELEAMVQRKNDFIDRQADVIDALDDGNHTLSQNLRNLDEHCGKLLEVNKQLRDRRDELQAAGQRILADRNLYMELWLKEMGGRVNAERSDRRNKMYLERARKSRNKAQRRLYALRAQVRRAEKKRKQR